jgi:tetratricopeptide (TPR) repeat protein
LGRFDHLEITDPNLDPKKTGARDSGIRDEDYYRELADEAFAGEDYERALAYYSRSLQYNIEFEECWFGQLRCLIDLGELREAIIWSKRALEKFPRSAQLLAATAVAEYRDGRTEPAIGYSDASLAQSGVTAYCWIARGEVLLTGNPTNSKACFTKAIELAPKDWSVRAAIAHAYRIKKQIPEAHIYYKQAVQLDEKQFTSWCWLGQCAEALKDYNEAAVAYRRTLAISPNCKKAKEALYEIQHRGFFSRLVDGIRSALKKS